MRRLAPFLFVALAACTPDVEGELRIGFRDTEPLHFAPSECLSGEPLEFFGVDMFDDDDHMLRLVHFPADGPELLFFDPGQANETFRITPHDCRKFAGELRRTNDEYDGYMAMEGDLVLDCDASNGERVVGQVEFRRCGGDSHCPSDW
ncbi:MAG: hypothetical protein AAF721_04230 [Myxococcota bacterium]